MSRDWSQQRVTVQEAAELQGVSESAIRKRVQRRKIPYEHDQEGRLWVWMDQAVTDPVNGPGQQKDKSRDWSHAASNDGTERYLRSLEDQVTWLRRELEGRTEEIRRRDHIIAALTENMRELRAAEHDDARVQDTATEESGESSENIQESDEEPPQSHERPEEREERVDPSETAAEPHSVFEEPEAKRSWWRRLLFGG